MDRKVQGCGILLAVLGAAFLAFMIPYMMHGGSSELLPPDLVFEPRFTATPTPLERALTQQAFALMFFTPTNTAAPTSALFSFLIPNTGPTQTFTATATRTSTLTATPTRTLLPVFRTQTQEHDGGGGGGGGGVITFTPTRTPTAGIPTATSVIASSTPVSTNTEPSPTDGPPTETPTDRPPNTHRPPTHTDEPTNTPEPPPPTDTPEPPPPTDTSEPQPTATLESLPLSDPITVASSTPSYLMQFLLMYVFGATFLGVIFRRV